MSSLLPAPSAPIYILESGFRHVIPYLHIHATNAPGRWVNKTLLDALCADFGRSFGGGECGRMALSRCIAAGLVKMNNEPALDATVIIPSGRLPITMLVHRHEPPVLDVELNVVHAGSYFAVNKPPSWPVHPGGPHNRNTVTGILTQQQEQTESSMHLLFRLDRLVSGLLVFATTKEACAEWLTRADSGTLMKIYCARVSGRLDVDKILSAGDVDVTEESGEGASWATLRVAWGLDGGGGEQEGVESRKDGDIEAFVVPVGEGESGPQTMGRPWWSTDSLFLGAQSPPRIIAITYPVREVEGSRGRFEAGPHTRVAATEETAAASNSSCTGKKVHHVSRFAAKASRTLLVPVTYDAASDTTTVLLRACSGRTHQLRVHCRALGHSIANDPSYNGADAHVNNPRDSLPCTAAPSARAALATAVADVKNAAAIGSREAVALDVCRFCSMTNKKEKVEEEEEEEEGNFRALIWLHALSYAGDGLRFGVPLPMWWDATTL